MVDPCAKLVSPLVKILAAASMAGDLLASFLKRRFGLKVHAQAIGLDQIPEALLPLLLNTSAGGFLV